MNKNILITFLLLLSISLSGYIVYDKVLNKDVDNAIINSNKTDDLQNSNNSNEKIKKKKIN